MRSPSWNLIFDAVSFGQLGLWPELAVDPVQSIPAHVAVISRRIGSGPERIQHRDVGLRDEAKDIGVLWLRDRRAGERGTGGGSKQSTAMDGHERD